MREKRLQPHAWVALSLTGLFNAADTLCSIFVSVYLWRNSQDFQVVCRHYMALYVVTPVFFLAAGWYSQARDRLHMYRLGLVLHAAYYALLLTLRERSPEYATELGALLGVTWGVFYAGANTINFDATIGGRPEYFMGLLQSIGGALQILAPLIGGLIIDRAPSNLTGYHWVFGLVIVLYLVSFVVSFRTPRDNGRRPFRIWRALFPGKDQRDWRLAMLASASMAGTFSIFAFLLGLLMYMKTQNEFVVGAYASYQALSGVIVSYFAGRAMSPRTWRRYMRWGLIFLLAAGAIIAFNLSVLTLVVFGFLRTVSGALFGIAHFSLRIHIIQKSAQDPAQRIEYLSAWEVPLAIGRVIMMTMMIGLYEWLSANELGLRMTLFVLCAVRIITYICLTRTSTLRENE
ncbi:MAG: MFS transporter [Candidatus Hydrogenedentes bacterium]|nr:MFS transporter [Candidatus Hydrogenedentota bacterium]